MSLLHPVNVFHLPISILSRGSSFHNVTVPEPTNLAGVTVFRPLIP